MVRSRASHTRFGLRASVPHSHVASREEAHHAMPCLMPAVDWSDWARLLGQGLVPLRAEARPRSTPHSTTWSGAEMQEIECDVPVSRQPWSRGERLPALARVVARLSFVNRALIIIIMAIDIGLVWRRDERVDFFCASLFFQAHIITDLPRCELMVAECLVCDGFI